MYEEYMQNLLGYRMSPYQNTYEQYNSEDCYMPRMEQMYTQTTSNVNEELENCYPEIYKIIYPMIKKACMENTNPVTEETIDRMVTEIYNNIETGDIINLNITLGDRSEATSMQVKENTTSEKRQGNFLLRDLIRILLIRELLGRPGGIRPFPPRPFPPRRPINRPPIMPRYDEYLNF